MENPDMLGGKIEIVPDLSGPRDFRVIIPEPAAHETPAEPAVPAATVAADVAAAAEALQKVEAEVAAPATEAPPAA